MPMEKREPAVVTTLKVGRIAETNRPYEVSVFRVYEENQLDWPMPQSWFRLDVEEEASALHVRELENVEAAALNEIERALDDHTVLASVLTRAFEQHNPVLANHIEEGASFGDPAIIGDALPAAQSLGMAVSDPDESVGPA